MTSLLANLDPSSRTELIGILNDLNKREGITMVISTHDVNAIHEFKLFDMMRCFGFNCEKLPLSLDDAVSGLTKVIETGGAGTYICTSMSTHTMK